MAGKEKIIITASFFLLLIALGIFLVFRWQKPQNSFPINTEEKANYTKSSPINTELQEIKKAPSFFSGILKKMSENDLELEFPGDIKYKYKIKKEEVANIFRMEKNPNFNKEKFNEAIKQVGASIQNNDAHSIAEEIDKRAANDPELQLFLNASASWEDLKVGSQLTVQKNESGKVNIVINSPEANNDNN